MNYFPSTFRNSRYYFLYTYDYRSSAIAETFSAVLGTIIDLSASRWSTILSYCRSCDLSSVLYSFYFSACRSDALREFDCFFDRDIV